MTDYNDKLHGNSRPSTYENARYLRKVQTPAERRLWQALRNAKVCNVKFRRQHALADYIADFYCHQKKLVIEVDGGVHDNPEVTAADLVRTKNLNAIGVTVLRFKNEEIENNMSKVIATITNWIESIQDSKI
jgi:very-short-patch-repair endonuclease